MPCHSKEWGNQGSSKRLFLWPPPAARKFIEPVWAARQKTPARFTPVWADAAFQRRLQQVMR
jgi:hypothetical protein